jgi:hypothetical protein
MRVVLQANVINVTLDADLVENDGSGVLVRVWMKRDDESSLLGVWVDVKLLANANAETVHLP